MKRRLCTVHPAVFSAEDVSLTKLLKIYRNQVVPSCQRKVAMKLKHPVVT